MAYNGPFSEVKSVSPSRMIVFELVQALRHRAQGQVRLLINFIQSIVGGDQGRIRLETKTSVDELLQGRRLAGDHARPYGCYERRSKDCAGVLRNRQRAIQDVADDFRPQAAS